MKSKFKKGDYIIDNLGGIYQIRFSTKWNYGLRDVVYKLNVGIIKYYVHKYFKKISKEKARLYAL